MGEPHLVFPSGIYLFYQSYTGTSISKALKDKRGVISVDIVNELLFSQDELMLEGYEFFLTDKNFNVSYTESQVINHKDYQGRQVVIKQIGEVEIGSEASKSEQAAFTDLIIQTTSQSRIENLSKIIYYRAHGEDKVAAISSIHQMEMSQFGYEENYDPETSFTFGISTNKSNYLRSAYLIREAYTGVIVLILLICGGASLVAILIIFFISQYVAKRLIKPISEINSKIENLMLSSEMNKEIPKGSKEVQTIYEAILDAQTTLNFANNGFLKVNDTEALLDFAQAYTIFKKVENKPAMLVCMNNIAVIHFKEGRYTDAAETFKDTIMLSKELRGTNEEMLPIQRVNLAFRIYMLALSIYYDAKTTDSVIKKWNIARKYFKNSIKKLQEFSCFHDYIVLIQILISDTYLEEEAALLGDQELISAEQLLTNLERGSLMFCSTLSRFGIVEIPLVILRQKMLVQRARNFLKVQSYKQAFEQVVNFMEFAPIYDPVDRETALDILKYILDILPTKFRIIHELEALRHDAFPSRKDIVIVYNYSERLIIQKASKIAQKLALHIFEKKVQPADRIGLFKFTKRVHKTFSLAQKRKNTAQLRNQFLNLNLPYGTDASLYRALKEAVIELNTNSLPRNSKWILLITCCDDKTNGKDEGMYYDLLKTLQQLDFGIIILGLRMKSQPRGEAKLRLLTNANERSIFVSDPSFEMVDLIFDTISPRCLQAHPMIMQKMS